MLRHLYPKREPSSPYSVPRLLRLPTLYVNHRRRHNFYLSAGRAIRRVVTLSDRVEDLVSEADRRSCMEQVNSDDDDPTSHSEDQECLYRNYQELIRWIPSLKSDLTVESEDYEVRLIMKNLNKGADGARGDDATGLKIAIVGWLMSSQPTPEPALEPRHKTGRGFYHDATARLICPVDYDWSNPRHRENIRNYHPDYLVTADCWPFFLYRDEHYDPENPVKGLFKNMFLVKAFKHIFTSPSSTDFESVPDDTDNDSGVLAAEPPLKHRKGPSDRCSCSHLRFALSSCTSWRVIDEDFNYEAFYNNILTFFEECHTERDKAEVAELLLWWNRSVFGRANMSAYRPQATGNKSVASTLRKRQERAVGSGSFTVVGRHAAHGRTDGDRAMTG
ncbi:hypothetical protein PISMIDRAFT_105693 [Pisolithus microcarpus 441]|uniref:Unplaced genomic scaffold scaffold_80, whole genome shotgun sequence n=1 Tax=Pisolithus microcarpus 441 TaxID=765257 RepID=A0A0C9YUX7_9AGAM|nr:hypothetical protein PISMIDRAFT_105693 [Pisolithus microcarpus 441]